MEHLCELDEVCPFLGILTEPHNHEADYQTRFEPDDGPSAPGWRIVWELGRMDSEELASAFRDASKACHPDLGPPNERVSRTATMRAVIEARERRDIAALRRYAEGQND